MAKRMMKLTVEEVRANIPYDLICMVRYGCTWSSGRRRRAWLADFSESEREAAGRLFRMAHNWTVGRGVPDTVQMSPEDVQPVAEARRLLRVHLKGGILMENDATKTILPSKEALNEFLKAHKYKSFPTAVEAARNGKKLVFIFLDWEAYGDRSYYYCKEDDTVYSDYLSIGD